MKGIPLRLRLVRAISLRVSGRLAPPQGHPRKRLLLSSEDLEKTIPALLEDIQKSKPARRLANRE